MSKQDSYSLDLSEMEDHYTLLASTHAKEEISIAQQLREREKKLVAEFKGFQSPDYDINDWVELLADMKQFEKELSNFEILEYLYGYIARVALNAQNFKDALCYANAGAVICENKNDKAGVWACQNIIRDLAVVTENFQLALDLSKQLGQPTSAANKALLCYLEMKAKLNIPPKFALTSKRKPSSFKYHDTEEGLKESKIRRVMKIMDISRSSARVYAKAAESLP